MTRVPTPSTPSVRAFGLLRLVRPDAEVELRRRRERNVLATLLAAHGRPVPADRLVTEAWGDEAPPQALASLQVAVSRLRRMLEPERSPRAQPKVLLSSAAGYSLALPVEAVDVWQFDVLVDRAAGAATPAQRREAAEAAEALWQAPPYAGCDVDAVVREAERLAERHVTVREIGAQALLDLDDPAAAVAMIEPLLVEHPYRERLWATHALGLYRTARQSDALDSLRQLRLRLAEDLGIDPSVEIRELEARILAQDPDLLAVQPTAGPVATAAGSSDAAGVAADRIRPALVGRGAVQGRLRELLDDVVARSQAQVVVISGEAGIGKSTLVDQLGTLASEAEVLTGRAHPDFAPALWPWLGVLRELWRRAPDPSDAPVVEPVLADLPQETDLGQGGVLRLFDAVARLIARAAGAGPLVIVLEDLHWADATSMRLLAHLAGQGLAAPVVLVVTLRTGEAAASAPLVATMADLSRAGAARLRLEGLDTGEVAELLADALGPHDERLDAVVAEVTAGNAFFVLQYAQLLQGRPDLQHLPIEELPVPEGVRDVLRQRLARLPDGARSLLATAAVAGRLDPELLSALTGRPIDEVLDLLDLSLASGLLAETGDGFEFAHALTREALASDLTAARRLRLHDLVSRALEARYGDVPDLLAEVAHHADLAAPLGPEAAARAATALAGAARVAQARRAYDEALELWERAGARAAGPDADVRRIDALVGAGHCLMRLARAPEARVVVAEAVEVARAAGRWDQVADAVAILNRSGVWAWREAGPRDERSERFVRTLHESLAHVDEARQARVLVALQVEHYYGWEEAAGDEMGERAVALARASGDEDLLVEVLLAHVVATSGPGKATTRLARLEELRNHPLRGEIAAFTEFTYARALYECARVEEADAAAARCAAAAAQLRHTGVEVPLAWWFHSRARDSEDPARIEQTRAALVALQREGTITGARIDVVYRLRMHPADGPLDPELVTAARHASPALRALIAHEVLRRGDARTAVDLLGEPSPSGASDYSVLTERCLRVAVLAGAGETEGLEEAVARIAPYSGDVVMFGAVEHLGAVDHFLALGAEALGDREAARRHCAAALELLARLGNRPWQRRAEALAKRLEATAATD
jgi:DNA-binding SARP family transcriptional activator